jgi:hypothetical protein
VAKRKAPQDTSIDKALEIVTGDVDVPLAKDKKLSFPEYGYFTGGEKKPCAWAFKKPFAPRVELEIVTDKKAQKLGVPTGPAIRLCYAKDTAAPLVHVKTVKEAVDFGNHYLACLKSDGKSKQAAEACSLKTAEGLKLNYKMAGVKRTSRRGRR